jgi:NAD(P)-dependent dehydrogenase (short-subunit alcohol dehydrogenase family)
MEITRAMAPFSLLDRVAIVTGGSRGIGLAIARGFAEAGAKVFVAARKPEACDEAAASIVGDGGVALAVPTHVGKLDDLTRLVDRAVETFGRLDIIVNNASNPLALPVGSITAEAFSKSYEVNVRAPLFLVQAALSHLKESPSAAIVNVITAGVFTHGTYVSLYVSGKAALLSLTRSMAGELSGDGIRVNALAPGTVATDMVFAMPEAFQQVAVDAQLIKRMAQPEEMVPAALFLASDASLFMTGQTIVLDGGMTTH